MMIENARRQGNGKEEKVREEGLKLWELAAPQMSFLDDDKMFLDSGGGADDKN